MWKDERLAEAMPMACWIKATVLNKTGNHVLLFIFTLSLLRFMSLWSCALVIPEKFSIEDQNTP